MDARSIDLFETVPDVDEWSTLFRQAVLQRYGHRCFVTGRTDVVLEAHHLYNVAHHPPLRRFVSNGRPMERDLHQRFHQEHGSRCTPHDLIVWRRLSDPSFVIGGRIILPYHVERVGRRKKRR